ncbi:DUF4143 domain-containing protein, partial [Acidithiobacillus caldus]|uniref:DUF4143 domain-containing protein n=1 Tax=Acidithiobacillus caldus TaxID=33059 RepID=UPI001D0341AA
KLVVDLPYTRFDHSSTQAYYYRTSGGAEIDLLLASPGGSKWAIEVKRSFTPRPERGFYAGCEDVSASHRFVVYPGTESFPLPHGVEAVSVSEFARRLHFGGHDG